MSIMKSLVTEAHEIHQKYHAHVSITPFDMCGDLQCRIARDLLNANQQLKFLRKALMKEAQRQGFEINLQENEKMAVVYKCDRCGETGSFQKVNYTHTVASNFEHKLGVTSLPQEIDISVRNSNNKVHICQHCIVQVLREQWKL